MERIIAPGCRPKKTPNETAPSRKAFPKDSFFLMKKRTRIKAAPTLIMAGIRCSADIDTLERKGAVFSPAFQTKFTTDESP